jgi:hypothetical protein
MTTTQPETTAAQRKLEAAKRKARAARIRELMDDEGCSRREAAALVDAGF